MTVAPGINPINALVVIYTDTVVKTKHSDFINAYMG